MNTSISSLLVVPEDAKCPKCKIEMIPMELDDDSGRAGNQTENSRVFCCCCGDAQEISDAGYAWCYANETLYQNDETAYFVIQKERR
jgi:hypothetical protein